MRVKVCGVCVPEDAQAAVLAGASYVGVILVPDRLRTQTLASAQAVLAAADGARRVGVFMNPTRAEVLRAVERLRLDVVQLHGVEPPPLLLEVKRAGITVWKVLPIATAAELPPLFGVYGDTADGYLLEGRSAWGSGGVGARLPWAEVAAERERFPTGPLFIAAGGLTPENVGAVVAQLRPHVVDVSSGVEREPGRKDEGRMQAFVAAVRAAAANLE